MTTGGHATSAHLSENVATTSVYMHRDGEFDYRNHEVALVTVDRNDVTDAVEVWFDDIEDYQTVHANLRMSPTAARALGQALIRAASNA